MGELPRADAVLIDAITLAAKHGDTSELRLIMAIQLRLAIEHEIEVAVQEEKDKHGQTTTGMSPMTKQQRCWC